MSKNTKNTGFRKINIDQFNEENYKDDDEQNSQIDDSVSNEAEVLQILSSYDR